PRTEEWPLRVWEACRAVAGVVVAEGGFDLGVGSAASEMAGGWAFGARLCVAGHVGDWGLAAEHRSHCDPRGGPFGMPVAPPLLQPEWLAWNNGTVVQLAQAIYDERRFEDLPILADALEEAGCTDATIFDHCRQPLAHVRGCWLVDALLGKK